MRILTNDNNEYFGLVSDYKNAQEFKDTIIADGAEGKIAIIATINMRPLTDHELSEEGDYSTYEPGHWIPVDVSCETSDIFYHAVETDIPVVEEAIKVQVPLNEEEQVVINEIDERIVLDDLSDAKEVENYLNKQTEEE